MDCIDTFVDFLFGEFDDEDGVFGHEAYKHYQSDLEIDVVFQSADPDSQIGSHSGYREGEYDGERNRPAFILGGKEEEDEEQGESEHKACVAAFVAFLI